VTQRPKTVYDHGGAPLISIVTVVLNAADTLERTIQSVTGQDFADFEYLIIDGGSTDGSLDIIRAYESKIHYWRSEPDDGVYDAMNKAVRIARGRWVLFVGADDVIVSRLGDIAPLLKDERTIYYGDVYMLRRQRTYDGPFNAYKIMFSNICQQAIFYPRRVFEVHRFDNRYKLWADHVLNMQCFGDKRFRFTYIGKLICLYNDFTGMTATTTDARFEADRESLIRRYLPLRLLVAYFIQTRTLTLRLWFRRLIRRAVGAI
jgi:glycosyltransferase involved in cell wall biosynthesis